MDLSPLFIHFADLPTELRIRVWRLSFPESRVVPVRYNGTAKQYTSKIPPPALLHACSESRSLFLETYTKFILSPKYDSAIYVDFDRDTIFFDDLNCSPAGDLALDLARSPHRDRILSCAIDGQVWEILRVFKFDSLSEVKVMPNLKTIALVVGNIQDRISTTYGGTNVFFEPDPLRADEDRGSAERSHIDWYTDSLRQDVQNAAYHWIGGNPPDVEVWRR